jgi:hypothetical protein
VKGYILNFGGKVASNVVVSMSWIVGGVTVSQDYAFGSMNPYSIKTFDVTYSFEGNGPFSYSVSWS